LILGFRENYFKAGAFSFGALNLNGAVVGLHNAFHDGKPEAGAVNVPGFLVFYPVKPIKNMLLIRCRNPKPGIRHLDGHTITFFIGPNLNLSAVGAIPDGIGNKIGHHLFEMTRLPIIWTPFPVSFKSRRIDLASAVSLKEITWSRISS